MPWIDINLNDIDTSDLISELEDRYLDDREQAYLLNLIKNNGASDARKMEFFLEVMGKYSMLELQEMFSSLENTIAGKNQLSLEL